MFGPLSFPSSITNTKFIPFDFDNPFTECILCDLNFELPNQQAELLSHIFNIHKLVIADVPLIASLSRYLNFWKICLRNKPIQEFCSTVLVDVKRDGIVYKDEIYFLLSDVLPQDRELREGLQKKRLEWALEQQRSEREDDTFKRGCLFCRLELKGSRAKYIEHLSTQHNLQLGRPYNLVFVDQLIDKIEQKMEDLQCLYCEKVFKDRNVLKEHMRKKLHKRINPENKEYDRFYIVNYLEMGKTWKEQQTTNRVRKDSSGSEEESDWSDWKEEEETIVCLFCDYASSSWNEVMEHIVKLHDFSYESNTRHLNFYQQVKLVNYIRRQIHKQNCITCDKHFDSNEIVLKHMTDEQHLFMPSPQFWDQPEYFFPTYENDTFLCQIEDNEDAEDIILYPTNVPENAEIVQRLQKLLEDS